MEPIYITTAAKIIIKPQPLFEHKWISLASNVGERERERERERAIEERVSEREGERESAVGLFWLL